MLKKLIIQNLTVTISNQILCRNLNCEFSLGETWAILGRNGSGKTTLLHTLAGLHFNFNGKIFLNSKSLHQYKRKELAEHIGLLLQEEESYFPLTVLENISLGSYPFMKETDKQSQQERTNKILTLLDLTSLSDRKSHLLSGGEKQRVKLARILLQAPQIYLLDEFLNNLDPFYIALIFQHLQELAKTRQNMIIMSLHNVNWVQRFCSHAILLFNHGEVLVGKTQDVMTKANLRALYQCDVII